MPRWHSWIARSPPKGQVSGSNPDRGTTFQSRYSGVRRQRRVQLSSTQEQQETGWQIYLRLLKYLKPLMPAFAVSIVGFMIFAATTPAQAKLLELLVDAIENKDHDARYYIPPAIAGVYLVRGLSLIHI